MVKIRCKCTNPCTCYFEYDGDRPNTIYKLPYEYGRYNTRRKGTGTAADPYIVEFLDSEEFRVEAGQARSTSLQTGLVSAVGTSGSFAVHLNQIDYETPNEIFLSFGIKEASSTVHTFLPSAHRFWFISAQATFVYNGTSVGHRRLGVYFSGPTGEFGFSTSGGIATSTIIAGASSSGLGEDVTLSCSGLAPFMNGADSQVINGPGGKVAIELMQSSGSNMSIKDVILTFVAL